MATVSSESAAGAVVQVKDKIELTEVEKQIFDRFVNTLRHFSLHTELRVAGGWVRDKVSFIAVVLSVLWEDAHSMFDESP